MLATILQRMDTNKDGKISKNEAEGRIAENFDRIDTNKDGFLDKGELQAMIRAANPGPGDPPGKDRPGPDAMLNLILQRMDKNKDGKIAKSEAEGRIADGFDAIDTNKDGFLDKTELQAMIRRMAPSGAGGRPMFPGNFAGRPDPLDFDAQDKDADGRLTKAELRGTRFADSFDQIDTNKDGKIDPKEWAAFHAKKKD